MYVTDICHGLAVAATPLAELDNYNRSRHRTSLSMLRDRNVCFHMAITSTYLTNVWQRVDYYPIVDIIRSGCQATIGTDDPVQCGGLGRPLSLDQEYGKLSGFGLTQAEVEQVRRTAEQRTAPWRDRARLAVT
jgi:adenosine deaminase